MRKLKEPFLQVEMEAETSFGGNQAWFPHKFLKRAGCGVISASDVLLYLEGRNRLSREEYMEFARYIRRYYLPVIPGAGMNGLTLMLGLNRYFRKNRLPYRACWKISGKKLISRIDGMLGKDIPVILSIGPNFPWFWRKESLKLYIREEDGSYREKTRTRAHFVTVTGRDGQWLHISSWGKAYEINISQYLEYAEKHSSFLVSNIICMKRRKRIK